MEPHTLAVDTLVEEFTGDNVVQLAQQNFVQNDWMVEIAQLDLGHCKHNKKWSV